MQTQVAIIGAGPAGLVLSHLLAAHGIESVILERRDRAYVEGRVRAGVLEQGTVDLLHQIGVGERLAREGLVHHGIYLQFAGGRHHVPMSDLTGGRAITIYGQQEVVKDLINSSLAKGRQILFEADGVALHNVAGAAPAVSFHHNGERHELRCDFIAGCDGFHGVCRPAIPAQELRVYERVYPFGWLGILATVAPSTDELIYSCHPRGFALFSMRSPRISRLYIQCRPDENINEWPDERIWEELHQRLETGDGWRVEEGSILEKGVTAMRSFVVEPMQYGRLFLAGDAAHVVPATGAKGLNLAVADVRLLAAALAAWYGEGRTDLLDGYSAACLRRVWRAQHFSYWMTSLLHRLSDDPFQQQLQLSELRYVVSSRAAATALAENYVGLAEV
jgi:p-hydroxybenzoate 3-monooxygenase